MFGSSWASGVNLYMSIAILGFSHRMEWIALPGDMEVLAHPLVIGVAAVLYVVEFVADKIPYVDSIWDTVHTAIRPTAGAALGYMAMADTGVALQIPVALLAGGVALDSHLTKATSRAAINASPEPVTNSIASVVEDFSVAGVLYLAIAHPVIATLLVILFIVFSVWFLKKMFKYVRKLFQALSGKQPPTVPPAQPESPPATG